MPVFCGILLVFVAVSAFGWLAVFALFQIERDAVCIDPVKGSLESLGLVDFTNGGFDGSGLTQGSKKLIGSHLGECFGTLGGRDVGSLENPLAGKEGKDGVTDPCYGTFTLLVLLSRHICE